MRKVLGPAVIFACSWLILMPASAWAQAACPEGRMASGACVDPALAKAMRKQVIIFTQPKISYAAPPLLPIEDRGYHIARDYHEMLYLFTIPQVTSRFETRPFPGF